MPCPITCRIARSVLPLILPCFFLMFQSNAQNIRPDLAYGSNGIITVADYNQGSLAKILPTSGGIVYVVYRTQTTINVAKYLPGGSLDAGFGNNGYTNLFNVTFADAAIDQAGRIVIAGNSPGLGGRPDLEVFRINPDGNIDPGFYFDGGSFAQLLYSFDYVTALTLQDDLVIIAGYHDYLNLFGLPPVAPFSNVSVLNSTGSVIKDFRIPRSATQLTMQAGNFLVQDILGTWRYTPAGLLDNSFGTNGMLANTGNLFVKNDKFYLARTTELNRYDYYANTDLTFNGSGIRTMNATTMAFQYRQAIVAGGNTISRLNMNGSYDNSFATAGIYSTGSLGGINEMFLEGNRLYVAGTIVSGIETVYAVAAFIIDEQAPFTFNCPVNKILDTDPGKCSAVVYGIDPLFPGVDFSIVRYQISGATTGSGTGSLSGKTFNKGTTTVAYSLISDPARQCSFTVNIIDLELPVLSNFIPSVSSLFPVDQQMVTVELAYQLSDNCRVESGIQISSSDPDSGTSAGDLPNDWRVIDAHHVALRAEVSPGKDYRLYTITFIAADNSNNKIISEQTIFVPAPVNARIKFAGKFDVKVLSNPTNNYFTLVPASNSKLPVTIRIMDRNGRILETKTNITANSTIRAGHQLQAGLYIAECTQGDQVVRVKLVKL